jgi:ABC-2 type transport system ATP-binding protein
MTIAAGTVDHRNLRAPFFPITVLSPLSVNRLRRGASQPSGGAYSLTSLSGIQISGLVKRYASVRALEHLDLTAQPGRITGLLGTNGAGKTTGLRILMGLVGADSGTALLDGRSYAQHPEPLRAAGFVGEDVRFHPARRGRDALRLVSELVGAGTGDIEAALTATELTEVADRPVGGYSLGMRQRLAIASALVPRPAALVLDEPMNGLDPQGVRWLRELLRAQAAQGHAVIVSSHLLSEMQQLIDDAVVIQRGRTLAEKPLSALLGPHQTFVAAADAGALAAALERAGATIAYGSHRGLLVEGMEPEAIGRVAMARQIAVIELTPQRRSLEDAFVALTGTAQA